MSKVHDIVPRGSRFKKAMLRLRLRFWAQGFVVCASQDVGLQKEMSEWPHGFTFLLKVLPAGPHIGLIKHAFGLHIIKDAPLSSYETIVAFKNTAIAWDVFCGRIGVRQAFCEDRFDFKGKYENQISVVRAMIQAQSMLFPRLADYMNFWPRHKKRVSRLKILSQILLSGKKRKEVSSNDSEVLRVFEQD